MNLPRSYKLLDSTQSQRLRVWLINRSMIGKVSYNWVAQTLSFEDAGDATAFLLAFDAVKHETKIDEMLKNESD